MIYLLGVVSYLAIGLLSFYFWVWINPPEYIERQETKTDDYHVSYVLYKGYIIDPVKLGDIHLEPFFYWCLLGWWSFIILVLLMYSLAALIWVLWKIKDVIYPDKYKVIPD